MSCCAAGRLGKLLHDGFVDGGQGRWRESDPESDGSEWTAGSRLRPRI